MPRKINFEWQIGEEDAWESLESAPTFQWVAPNPTASNVDPANSRPIFFRLCSIILISMLLCGIGMAASSLWRDRQVNVIRVQADLQHTIDRESRLLQPSIADSSSAHTLQTLALPIGERNSYNALQEQNSATQVIIQKIELENPMALVEVQVSSSGATPAYRETRFYQRASNGWQRIAPERRFWGPQHTFETKHIRFLFSQRDSSLIERASAEVDTLYMMLCKTVGLAKNAEATKLSIEIAPLDRGTGKRKEPGRITTPSPALRGVPTGLTDVQVLTQSLFEPLLVEVVHEASRQVQVRPQWELMISGLRTWLRAEYSAAYLPQWSVVLAALRQQVAVDAPHTLEDILFSDVDSFFTFDSFRPYSQEERAWAAQTVFDYIATTYGKEQIPKLLTGLGRHNDWTTLIPSVFNLPATEFEHGWQEFVRGQLQN